MSKLSFLEHIFSITNYGFHKQICILGIKIRIYDETKYKNFYDCLPVQNNKILFKTFNGAYTCNPKYIAEEILKQNLPYDLVWVVNKDILKYINDFPKNIRLVMKGSPEDVKEHKTAKIWIDNLRKEYYVKKHILKKDNQVYIQTFHGSLGIKKSGDDNPHNRYKSFMKYARLDSKQIDYLTSNGTYTTNFFKRMFWDNGNIIECGHPRNDVFFKDNSDIKKKVYEYYNIPSDAKIIMYAPTFREDGDMSCYSLNFEKLLSAVSKKFGGKWVVIMRLHPRLVNLMQDCVENKDYVIDATNYSDIQELMVSADAIVTDYSSCIYDFMLSRKPGFIYATDVEKYNNGRGLYYPLTSTPFPVASNNDEMVKNIEQFDYDTYKVGVEEFLKEKGCIDDGHASERVVELIKNIIDNAQEKEQTDKQEACV